MMPDKNWICKTCGHWNEAKQIYCGYCGLPFKEEHAELVEGMKIRCWLCGCYFDEEDGNYSYDDSTPVFTCKDCEGVL